MELKSWIQGPGTNLPSETIYVQVQKWNPQLWSKQTNEGMLTWNYTYDGNSNSWWQKHDTQVSDQGDGSKVLGGR